jgi:hypothetical protein
MFKLNLTDYNNIPAPIFPDFSSDSEWTKKMMRAKQEDGPDYWPTMRKVFEHDFKTLPKNRFKVWASVWNVPFISLNRYSEYYRVCLEAANKKSIYKEALQERGVGMNQHDAQILMAFNDFPTTTNRMQAMAHFIINGWTPEKLRKLDTIVELVGGIGDMCDIAYRLGFEGKYVIYDFPEVANIQRYYMGELGNNKVEYVSDFNNLQDSDLVIGTWSFTEMPIDLRNKIMSKIGKSKNWLLAYSNKIFDLDNASYLNDVFLPQVSEGKNIDDVAIPFMPWHGGNAYLSVTEKK